MRTFFPRPQRWPPCDDVAKLRGKLKLCRESSSNLLLEASLGLLFRAAF